VLHFRFESALFFDGRPEKGVCAAGGGHEAAGFNFVLAHDIPESPTKQGKWRFCVKCQEMFFDGFPLNPDGSPNKGICAAGGGHEAAGFNFVLTHDSHPEIRLEDEGFQVRVSGTGFTPIDVVIIKYSFNNLSGASFFDPIEIQTDINGGFAGIILKINESNATNIQVTATDRATTLETDKSLRN
jgi:hypothetical protein